MSHVCTDDRVDNDFVQKRTEEPYVCTLDEASVDKALEELNEKPESRLDEVRSLRAWIEQHEYLNYRTDTNYLLQILRTRKFNQPEARRMIERNLRSMQSQPRWFQAIDTHDPKIQAVIDTGVFVPLPGRDDKGRSVVLSQRGNLQPDCDAYHYIDDFIRAALVLHLLMCRDEVTQVNGIVHFYDFSSFTMKHMKGWGFENFRNIIRCWAGNFPGRFKGFHVFGGGHVMNIILMVFKMFLPRKYSKRLYVHGYNMETVYETIPKRMLPIEYLPENHDGPSAGTLREVIEKVKEATLDEEFRQEVLFYTSSQMWINDT